MMMVYQVKLDTSYRRENPTTEQIKAMMADHKGPR